MAVIVQKSRNGERHYFWDGGCWMPEFPDGRKYRTVGGASDAARSVLREEELEVVFVVENYGHDDEAWTEVKAS